MLEEHGREETRSGTPSAAEELARWFRNRLANSPSLRFRNDVARKAHVSETVVSDLFRAVGPSPRGLYWRQRRHLLSAAMWNSLR